MQKGALYGIVAAIVVAGSIGVAYGGPLTDTMNIERVVDALTK